MADLFEHTSPRPHDEDKHFLLAHTDLAYHLQEDHGVRVMSTLAEVSLRDALEYVGVNDIDVTDMEEDQIRLQAYHDQIEERYHFIERDERIGSDPTGGGY